MRRWMVAIAMGVAAALVSGAASPSGSGVAQPAEPVEVHRPAAELAVERPNIFFYNLDDLRDGLPGHVDPLQFMPKVRQWMAGGTRYTKSFVSIPSCCPSRASLMTGRYPHNNGVRQQSQILGEERPQSQF